MIIRHHINQRHVTAICEGIRVSVPIYGCDIGGKTLKWIDSFLCYRQQRVVVNGANRIGPRFCLVSHRALSSVPCFFFFLYINDISTYIDSEIRLFADDCVCYRETKATEDTLKLQKDIDQLGCWARKMGCEISTCQMQYNANNKEADKKYPCFIHSGGNGPRKCRKYLGVTIIFAMEYTSAIFALRLIGSLAS